MSLASQWGGEVVSKIRGVAKGTLKPIPLIRDGYCCRNSPVSNPACRIDDMVWVNLLTFIA